MCHATTHISPFSLQRLPDTRQKVAWLLSWFWLIRNHSSRRLSGRVLKSTSVWPSPQICVCVTGFSNLHLCDRVLESAPVWRCPQICVCLAVPPNLLPSGRVLQPRLPGRVLKSHLPGCRWLNVIMITVLTLFEIHFSSISLHHVVINAAKFSSRGTNQFTSLIFVVRAMTKWFNWFTIYVPWCRTYRDTGLAVNYFRRAIGVKAVLTPAQWWPGGITLWRIIRVRRTALIRAYLYIQHLLEHNCIVSDWVLWVNVVSNSTSLHKYKYKMYEKNPIVFML